MWLLDRIKDPVVEYLQAQDFTNLSLNQLRKVKMQHFSGFEPEMHFVKILLAHSTILKKMTILANQGTYDGKGFTILKELTRFPRASPKAEVIYLNPDER
ncbi:F-box/FBD/LRR-repeat protein [Camellia lanceoleosa]|uniref:F-box/FBD/LRR-repeat protein n=1 Tax=Camellia lanceoleosa TaxID=1840588 RepID=A0ACC0IE80_9ERIC|nr:F-box/FBD/LRR-repeat protein [Camellia lanceoleosa]